jgi:hypothetical protein
MYFFFHLITGIILGFLLSDMFKDHRWVLPCAVGAILPDLIDKPLGHIFFAETIAYGRIYGHTLLFFFLVLILGLLVWHFWKTPLMLAVSVGVFSHSILDFMWWEMENWTYPFMGPFAGKLSGDEILILFHGEISNPSEIVLVTVFSAAIVLVLLSRYFTDKTGPFHRMLKWILIGSAGTIFVLSGIVVGLAIAKKSLKFSGMGNFGFSSHEELFIVGIMGVLASFLLWRWQAALGAMQDDES